MKKITLGVAVVALAATATFVSTRAFFSDTETSTGNVFAAGSLDLQVGVENFDNSSPVAFTPQNLENRALFTFASLRPGQSESGNFLLESDTDVWACGKAEIASTEEDTINEAEGESGDESEDEGELQNYIEFATWVENTVDGKVGTAEQSSFHAVALTDYARGDWIPLRTPSHGGTPIPGGEVYEQGFAYCFGEFARTGADNGNSELTYGEVHFEDNRPVCNGRVENINQTQTDRVEGAIHFYAEQSADNENFSCDLIDGDDGTGESEDEEGLNPTYVFNEDGRVISPGSGDATIGETFKLQEHYGGLFELHLDENGDDFVFTMETPFDVTNTTSASDANSAALLFDADDDGTADFQFTFADDGTFGFQEVQSGSWVDVSTPSGYAADYTASASSGTFTFTVPEDELGSTFRVLPHATDNNSPYKQAHVQMFYPTSDDPFNVSVDPSFTSSENYITVTES